MTNGIKESSLPKPDLPTAQPRGSNGTPSAANLTTSHVLSSWKEIAAYLGKSVRTVQRMEVELGLPVRRPAGHPRSAVMAIPAELDNWLKSFSPQRGSQFIAQPALQAVESVPRRILVVEDQEVILYAVSRQLRALGYDVVSARSGKEALDIAASLVDVVLLDLNLPEIHGLEVLRRLRTSLTTGHIPIICTSATYSPEGAAPVALQLGASRFLAHPINPETLDSTIRELLNAASMAERA